MNKKIMLVFLVVLSIFMVTSCKGGSSTATDTKLSGTQMFVEGTEGLVFDFSDAFVSEIPDNSNGELFLSYDIENMGMASVGADADLDDLGFKFGQIKVSGLNLNNFKIDGRDVNPDVDLVKTFDKEGLYFQGRKLFEGKEQAGGIGFISFDPLTYTANQHGDSYFNFRTSICYEYGSMSVATLCNKGDDANVMKSQGSALCVLNEDKDVKNTAGPVQVKNLKQTYRKKGIGFLFDVENVNKDGNVFGVENNDKLCDDSYDNEFKNKIYVEVNTISGDSSKISCSSFKGANSGYVNLAGGKSTISCTLKGRAGSSDIYEEDIIIKTHYLHGYSKDQKVIVKDMLD